MIDWIGVLEKTTQEPGWMVIDGPDSGVHPSGWFGREDSDETGIFARLNIVQGRALLVLVDCKNENSNRVLCEGPMDKIVEDPQFADFVLQETISNVPGL